MTPLEKWNERYRGGEHGGSDPSPIVVHAAGLMPPGSSLDLACGAGRNALWLAEHGWSVTAVDGSDEAVAILRRRAAERGLRIDIRLIDLECAPLPFQGGSFDLVCDILYLQRDLFPILRRLVRPGGLFVGSIHVNDDSPAAQPMNPAFLLEPGELRRYLPGWEVLLDGEINPGEAPHGRRTAEIVARRPQ
jgi:tellurite methyltransferase